jgi:hypothetical protein
MTATQRVDAALLDGVLEEFVLDETLIRRVPQQLLNNVLRAHLASHGQELGEYLLPPLAGQHATDDGQLAERVQVVELDCQCDGRILTVVTSIRDVRIDAVLDEQYDELRVVLGYGDV